MLNGPTLSEKLKFFRIVTFGVRQTMTSPVVTRFAPSPTGFLHIGGARTALFNWLYASTPAARCCCASKTPTASRSTDAAIDAIKNGLTWLGLDWDGDAVSQFSRADRHREVVEQLLANGKAYRCYCTPEELTEMREKAMAEGKPPRYDGRWRDRPASEAPQGVPPVVRFKAPKTAKRSSTTRCKARDHSQQGS
jgi:glutamyl-tRNA synthetase